MLFFSFLFQALRKITAHVPVFLPLTAVTMTVRLGLNCLGNKNQ